MGYSPSRFVFIPALALLGLALIALTGEGYALVWGAAALTFLAALVMDALFLPRKRAFHLACSVPEEVGVGTDVEVVIALQNDGVRRATGRLWVTRPESFDGSDKPMEVELGPGALLKEHRTYRTLDRGVFTLGDATLEMFGPLGLMRRIVRLKAPRTIAAIPGVEVLHSNELILQAMQDAEVGITRSRGVGRGGEFASLAPYVPGDPPASVDWKGYARSGQLTVRRYEPERRRYVMLACDAGRLMGGRVGGRRKVDLALASFARLAAVALRRGDLVGLTIFDGAVQTLIPPRAGPGQLARIVRASLDVKANHTETAYTPAFVAMGHALTRRSLVVLATDFDNDAQGWELRRNLSALRRKHVVMICGMRDPVFHETVGDPIHTLDDAYRQLAALTLLEERHNVYHAIRRGGIHTIDAEPDELSGPMLNLYGKLVQSGAV